MIPRDDLRRLAVLSSSRLSAVRAAFWRWRIPIFTALAVWLFLCLVVKGVWVGVTWVLPRATCGPLSDWVFQHNPLLGAGDLVAMVLWAAVNMVGIAAHPWRPGRVTAGVSAVATVMWLLLGIGSYV